MNTEIEINGNSYQLGKIDAMKQLHVSRRVLPVLVAAGVSMSDLSKQGEASDEAWLMKVAEAGLGIVSKMSDADVEYVIHTCLGVVRRRASGSDQPWAPVMNGKLFQFQDLELPVMIRISIAVLRENMGGFFPALPASGSTKSGS